MTGRAGKRVQSSRRRRDETSCSRPFGAAGGAAALARAAGAAYEPHVLRYADTLDINTLNP